MLITIPDVLTVGEVAQARAALDAAEWVDGKVTAGYQAQRVKENLQLPEGHPVTVKLGEMVLASAGAVASVHVGCVAAASLSADVQSVYGRRALRHACGHRDPREGDDGTADQDGCFGYFVSVGAGGV